VEESFVKSKLIKYGILSLLVILVLSACGASTGEAESMNSSSENNTETINVMTSFYPMYEFANQVAGDRANVDIMISGGEDSHSYEPSAQDVAEVSEADVFVYSSDQMEYWVSDMLETVENDSLNVVRAEDGLPEKATNINSHEEHETPHNHEERHNHHSERHSHNGEDPHTWIDPVYAQKQVDVIKDALIEADPDGEEIYTKNANTFKKELQNLHEDFQAAFSDAENRTFVTQHQAFGHLAKRYDLNQESIGGLSTDIVPSPSEITDIIEQVKDYRISVIYYQAGTNSSIAETVASEAGIEVAPLYDLEKRIEEMQEQGYGYIEAMRKNLDNLKSSIK